MYPARSAGDTVRVNVLIWMTLSGHMEYSVSSAFEDADSSGLYREGGAFVPGITVRAVDQNGETAAQAQTDGFGVYTLSPLLPGAYSLRFILSDDYVASSAPASPEGMYSHITFQMPEYGQTDSFTLSPGQ